MKNISLLQRLKYKMKDAKKHKYESIPMDDLERWELKEIISGLELRDMIKRLG